MLPVKRPWAAEGGAHLQARAVCSVSDVPGGGWGTMKLSVENIKTQNSQPLLCYPIILRLMQWLGWVLAGKGSFALVFIKRTVA